MSEGKDAGQFFNEPEHNRRMLVAGLLLGGAALIAAGVFCWVSNPPRRANRLMQRAEKKIDEIEEILSMWPGG